MATNKAGVKQSNRSPVGKAAEDLCRKLPDVPTRTLARRLAKEFGVTIEQARSMIRSVRGQNGDHNRSMATVPKAAGKAGTKPQMPPSISEAWEPFELSAKRVGVMSDQHIPYHCPVALGAAVKDLKSKRIDCLLLNGDYADFYTISRWQKNPKKRDLEKELEYQVQGLKWLRSEFPKARIVYKMGNHDERWDHWLWNCAPEISDHPRMRLSTWLEFEDIGIEMVADQRPVLAGKLPIFHGHELGRSIFSPVNPARGAFLRTHHTVLVGHSHQTSGHADTNLWHEETFVWSTGCLCTLTPEYARVNRWNHGHAVIDIASDGAFDVMNMRINRDGEVRKS